MIFRSCPKERERPRRTETSQPRTPRGSRPAPGTPRNNLALGNPSNATSDPTKMDNYLLEKNQFVLSYNNTKGEANWVSWELKSSDIGDVERMNNFHPESALPDGFKRVTPDDYTGSGFDRGHLCNSKDRTCSSEDNSETFSMANMIPQTGDLNRHVWEGLESYSRKLAFKGNDLYIIAGGYGSLKTIGKKNKVTVPERCWKIICYIKSGSDIVSAGNDIQVIAVDMPNVDGIAEDDWAKYTTTIREIESKTGLDFLSKLPKQIQDALETRRSAGPA